MPYFRLNNSSAIAVGAQSFASVTEINFDEVVDSYFSEVDGSVVLSDTRRVTGSMVFEVETDDITVINAVTPGPATAGALDADLANSTAGNINVASTNLQFTQRTLRAARNGLATVSAQFVMDDMTIAAISA